MAFQKRSFWPFLISFWMTISNTRAELESSDRYCLKSIRDSLEDPRDIFPSWDSDNNNKKGYICQFFGVTCWNDNEDRVLSLELQKWGLKGQFPRGLENCTSLVWLNLSSNDLSGPIPSDISRKLPFLSKLDLSNNNFSGPIPPSISNCTFLNILMLSNNKLTGQIPEQIGQLHRIRKFSVANNFLTGPVPVFSNKNVNVGGSSYANNSGLCGGPLLKFCNPGPSSRAFVDYKRFREGFIVGYFFSATYVVVVCTFCCVPWGKLKQKKRMNKIKKHKQVSECFSFVKGKRKKKKKEKTHVGEWLPHLELVEKGSKEMSAILETLISRMSFAELCKATDGFSVRNTIGVGKMGMMYKAWLPNGWFLAVKRLYNSHAFESHFVSEIMILGRYRHRNMVPLLGFCIEKNERFLVYQFMSNGRLYDWLHLHPLESETRKKLEWPLRVKIGLGIARGLSWLHHNSNLNVAHLSISTECVLLDQKFEPKISNFGEAKFMEQNVAELGFMRKDVHDFGVVLFELITGKKFEEMADFVKSKGCPFVTNFSNLSSSNYSSGFFDGIDKSLIGKGFEDEIFTLLRFAFDCVQPFPDQTPTMLEIYNKMCSVWDGYGLMISSDCETFYNQI